MWFSDCSLDSYWVRCSPIWMYIEYIVFRTMHILFSDCSLDLYWICCSRIWMHISYKTIRERWTIYVVFLLLFEFTLSIMLSDLNVCWICCLTNNTYCSPIMIWCSIECIVLWSECILNMFFFWTICIVLRRWDKKKKVCEYVCMYTYIYVQICIFVCTYTYICICIHLFLYI